MYKEINIRNDYYDIFEDEKDRADLGVCDSEEDKLRKASVLIRNTIHNHLNPWLEKIREDIGPGKEQIYEWKDNGHKEVYFWLKKRRIENPQDMPNEENTKNLFNLETAVWLMYKLNGKKLDKRLERYQFTIPLMAEKLVRLKY